MWLWLRRKNGKSHKSRAIFLLSSSLSFEEIVLQLQLRGEHQRLQSCQLSVSSLWLCKANRLKARFPALHWSIAHIRFGSASLAAYHPAQWAVSAPTQFNQPQLLVGLWLWIELWDAHTYPHTHTTHTQSIDQVNNKGRRFWKHMPVCSSGLCVCMKLNWQGSVYSMSVWECA